MVLLGVTGAMHLILGTGACPVCGDPMLGAGGLRVVGWEERGREGGEDVIWAGKFCPGRFTSVMQDPLPPDPGTLLWAEGC